MQVSENLVNFCRFLLARCYFDIGFLTEAEDAILFSTFSSTSVDEIADLYEDQSCYVFLLLGDICRRQGRVKDAIIYYKKCLELNPLMWSAFKNLCNIGEYVDPNLIFYLTEKLSLTTPAYAVILDDVAYSNTRTTDNKPACDKMSLRENINPDNSYNILSSTGCENISQEAAFHLDLESHSNVHHSYVSYCAKNFTNEADSFKHIDNLITPDVVLPSCLVPKAPKLGVQGDRKVGRNVSNLDMNVEEKSSGGARFGMLSALPQSPMFACVPVFSRLNNSTNNDTLLTGSVRFGLNQCLSTHQNIRRDSNSDDSQQVQRTRNLSTSNVNSSLTGNRRVNFIENEANINVPPNPKCPNQTTDKNYSSTANTLTTATTTGALRHLVSATTFNLGFLTLDSVTNSSTNPSINSPNTRTDPPLLRSATHRNVIPLTPCAGGAQVSPLVSRSNMQLFNPVSHNHGVLSSSSTPRTYYNQMVSSSVSLDVHSSGPRTRSQVAAAAAVARASGIQRRSSRLVRSRGHPRKLDSRQPECLEDSLMDQSKSFTDLDSTNVYTEDLNKSTADQCVSFGLTDCHKTPTDCLSSKLDPRVNSLKQYLELLAQLGIAYQLLVRHHWRSATSLLSKLPASQLPTGRILAWAARAHMDNTDYQTAYKIFAEARRREPWQLCGMDFYSTVLWQLQSNQELSELAHDLLELDRNAAEPWCAVGNCFSLQGEHELAIKFFRRALQVCPTNAYAWTLLGHEQSTLEEYERALAAFQHALQLDSRHYNALFGLSNVYYKQEKFDLAETYLNRAVSIFPNSHLLLTNLAALRSRLGRIDDGAGSAMDLLNRACKIQPNNPLARYHRASILFHLGQYSDVFSELKKLLVLTPREAMVYLMIGHTYKKLGNTPQAMIHYSWAMELDPKGANTHLRDIMANPAISDRRSISTGVDSRLTAARANFEDNDSERNSATDEDMTHSGLGIARDTLRGLRDFSLLFDTVSLDEEEQRNFDEGEEQYDDTMELNASVDNNNNNNNSSSGRNEATLPDE